MPHPSSSRRTFLTSAAVASAGFFAAPRRGTAATVELHDTRVITPEHEPYAGWSTLGQRSNGELIVVWSGGRVGHVCPFGQVRCMTSTDEGRTWTRPRVLVDGPIDDRDAGVLETPRGALLLPTFSSLAYEPSLTKAEQAKNWPATRLVAWQTARDVLSAEERKQALGTWMIRSTDGGQTWSPRYDCLVNSPHGPTALADGRLLYAGKQLWHDNRRIGVAVSNDDGVTWEWLAEIPTRPGDNLKEYHELHAIQTPSGRIITQIRNHNKTSHHETLQTESDDGGKTWSVPHSIGVWGFPSHLLRLRDGRLVMSYGHRRAPIGNLARLSSDDGTTWSDPLTISADATSGDLGYPSTVELQDGSLLSVWYEKLQGRNWAVLRQARWSIRA